MSDQRVELNKGLQINQKFSGGVNTTLEEIGNRSEKEEIKQ